MIENLVGFWQRNYISVDNAEENLYNDIDPEIASKWAKELNHQSRGVFQTKSRYAPWDDAVYEGRCTYFKCEKDLTIPVEVHEGWAAAGNMSRELLNSGHSPFLSMPDKLVEAIIKTAEARIV